MPAAPSNATPSHSRAKECNEEQKCLELVQQQSKPKQSLLMVSNGNVQVLSNKSKKRKCDENTAPAKHRRLDGIYVDPKPLRKKQKPQTSVAVQTERSSVPTKASVPENDSLPSASSSNDETERIINMLTSETPTSAYFEELAEQRREALEESLIENKRLDEENTSLREEVTHLKEENKLLDEMVQEAKELAQLVETFTAAADPDGE